jgi:DNA-binding transcriptional LysR family regulator
MDGPAIDVRRLFPPVLLPVALVWRRQRTLPPAARAFVDFVRDETGRTGRADRR